MMISSRLPVRQDPIPTPAPAPAPQPAPQRPPVDRAEVTSNFIELTRIDGGSGNERQVADTIKQKLAALGIEAREDGAGEVIGGNTGNLIAEIPGTIPDAPGLIFLAHMDTVDVSRAPKPIITDGVIHTDGSTGLGADDRAGCTEILQMLKLVTQNNLPHPPIQVIFCVGEEAGLLGSEALKKEDLHGRLGFAVDSFHPNEIFWGWDGPLFKGDKAMREAARKQAHREFDRPSRPQDQLRPHNIAEGFLLDFTRAGIRGIGMEPAERKLWGASSDAASLRDKGIPAITIGCGEEDEHTTSEHVSQDDLQKSTELLLSLIEEANTYKVDGDGKIVPREKKPAAALPAQEWLIASPR